MQKRPVPGGSLACSRRQPGLHPAATWPAP